MEPHIPPIPRQGFDDQQRVLTKLGKLEPRKGSRPSSPVQGIYTLDTLPSVLSGIPRDMPSLDTLPIEIFHNVASNLPPEAIAALAVVCRDIYSQLFAHGSHLWRELVLGKYDPVHVSGKLDWKLLYQSRNWVEKVLRMEDPAQTLEDIATRCEMERPAWMVTGKHFLEILRDMILENGNLNSHVRNQHHLHCSRLVQSLRLQKEHSQLSAAVTIFLSPIAKFDPKLLKPVFSAAQRAVYVPSEFPLFSVQKTPNFPLILSILKFFQHHLDHMREHVGPITQQELRWNISGDPEANAFQPGPPVTKHDYDNTPSKIEGDWIGLYSYLGWADFEALRDGNPAVLEANRSGHLRDYLGGPQQLTIRLPKPEDLDRLIKDSPANSIDINGEGINGGSFIFKGRLRRVYLPSDIFGDDKYLFWRLTFVKTYANGENSWTRWIYDGIYCPGVGILGRWRDGTEPPGTGVTGPFWIWPKGQAEPERNLEESSDDGSVWVDIDDEDG